MTLLPSNFDKSTCQPLRIWDKTFERDSKGCHSGFQWHGRTLQSFCDELTAQIPSLRGWPDGTKIFIALKSSQLKNWRDPLTRLLRSFPKFAWKFSVVFSRWEICVEDVSGVNAAPFVTRRDSAVICFGTQTSLFHWSTRWSTKLRFLSFWPQMVLHIFGNNHHAVQSHVKILDGSFQRDYAHSCSFNSEKIAWL